MFCCSHQPRCQDPPVGDSSKPSQPTGKDTRGVRWKMYSEWVGGSHIFAFYIVACSGSAQNIFLDVRVNQKMYCKLIGPFKPCACAVLWVGHDAPYHVGSIIAPCCSTLGARGECCGSCAAGTGAAGVHSKTEIVPQHTATRGELKIHVRFQYSHGHT